jgi:hypothetical protein
VPGGTAYRAGSMARRGAARPGGGGAWGKQRRDVRRM